MITDFLDSFSSNCGGRKIVPLPHSFQNYKEELIVHEGRNDCDIQDRSDEPSEHWKRDAVDEDISFDTENDDNVSLNSIHAVSKDDEKKDITVSHIVSTNIHTPKTSSSKRFVIATDSVKSARDGLLLDMIPANYETVENAIAGLPDHILYLAVCGFLEPRENTKLCSAAPTPKSLHTSRDSVSCLKNTQVDRITGTDHDTIRRAVVGLPDFLQLHSSDLAISHHLSVTEGT